MTSNEIRKKFIEYFEKHGHKRMESSSLVPDEPTLLLTTAGMVQMMPYLLAQKDPPHVRVCSVQKCFRTTDIDDIGSDGRHLTFFEMLGSWSFGDYYKRDAINLAYNLIVDEFGFNKDKIWASVFKGENGIPKDEESIQYWKEIGVPEERIVELGWDDNFWGPPGNEGPCGPSTEIYYDMLSDEYGDNKDRNCIHMTAHNIYTDLDKECRPGCECDRFLEIWNAGVFTEYYRDTEKNFKPLPQKNVDTGAGLERMASFLQGKADVFETDALFPIVKKVKEMLPKAKEERPIRIISDHIRGIVFLITDGVLPSNEHRGYVLRKIIRKAIVQVMLNEGTFPFLNNLVDSVVEIFHEEYPYLKDKSDYIKNIIDQEEKKFSSALKNSLKQMNKMLETTLTLTGKDIFQLTDTYGMPVEIVRDILKEKGLVFDKESYDKQLEIQRTRSRETSKFKTRE